MRGNLLQRVGIDDPVGSGAVQGEVVEFNGQSIVIVGPFAPSDGLQLRPGARVIVLTEGAIDEVGNLAADAIKEATAGMRNSLSDARDAIDDIEDSLDELKT